MLRLRKIQKIRRKIVLIKSTVGKQINVYIFKFNFSFSADQMSLIHYNFTRDGKFGVFLG